MERFVLSNDQWRRMRDHLPRPAATDTQDRRNRRFVEAVFWIARTGAPWRDLPRRFGSWGTVYRRFYRWTAQGVWPRLMQQVGTDPDLEMLLLDSTIVRAHQHAAGARKKTDLKP